MARSRQGKLEREAYWRGHLAGWKRSGASVRGYCKARGLSEALFHYWKRELKRRSGGGAQGALPVTTSSLPAFSELPVVQVLDTGALLAVELRGGRRVQVWPGFDEETLARVVAALERVGC